MLQCQSALHNMLDIPIDNIPHFLKYILKYFPKYISLKKRITNRHKINETRPQATRFTTLIP